MIESGEENVFALDKTYSTLGLPELKVNSLSDSHEDERYNNLFSNL